MAYHMAHLRAMAVIDSLKSTNRLDYELASQPLGVMPKDYANGFTLDVHAHERGQIIHAISGVMRIRTNDALWLLPPLHALWMPPNMPHDMQACGAVALRTLYIRRDVLPEMAPRPKVLSVSALLRELLLRAARVPIDYRVGSHDDRVMQVLLGEVALACEAPDFHLRHARDRRLARVCDALIAEPGDGRELTHWADLAGCSARTLARLFTQEFGVAFGAWRQQVRLMAALPRLARGETVTAVGLDLGYATPSAFAEVFRRWLGAAPSTYFDRP